MSNPDYEPEDPIAHLLRSTVLDLEARERTADELHARLQLGRPLRVKLGLDPRSLHLHIGHLVPLLALRRFMDLNHRAYLVFGGFTAMIGDPSGRRMPAAILSADAIQTYAESYRREALRILDPARTVVVNNATWLDALPLREFAQELAGVDLHRILRRRDFRDRETANKPIGPQELLYPILRAYDSMVLCAAPSGREDDPTAYTDALGNPDACCDVEIGGEDQEFNLELAREMMQNRGLPPQICIVTRLVNDRDRQRMGSRGDNGPVIRLIDPPLTCFTDIMKLDDEDVLPNLPAITEMPDAAIREYAHGLRRGAPLIPEAKERLAFEVVTLLHGAQEAEAARQEFHHRRFHDYAQIPDREFAVPEECARGEVLVSDLVLFAGLAEARAGIAQSKETAQQLIEQGVIFLDGERVRPGQRVVIRDGMILQRGHRPPERVVRLCLPGTIAAREPSAH